MYVGVAAAEMAISPFGVLCVHSMSVSKWIHLNHGDAGEAAFAVMLVALSLQPCCVLCVACCVLCVACCVLRCVLCVACCVLRAVCCAVCCVLRAVCCVLRVACCVLCCVLRVACLCVACCVLRWLHFRGLTGSDDGMSPRTRRPPRVLSPRALPLAAGRSVIRSFPFPAWSRHHWMPCGALGVLIL